MLAQTSVDGRLERVLAGVQGEAGAQQDVAQLVLKRAIYYRRQASMAALRACWLV